MIIVYDSDGNITQQLSGAVTYVKLDGLSHLEVDNETNIDPVRQKVENGKIVDKDASIITQNMIATTEIEIKMRRVQLLYDCDWTQAADSPLSESKKAEWRTYRQALRDFPATCENETNIDEVVFPTPPAS